MNNPFKAALSAIRNGRIKLRKRNARIVQFIKSIPLVVKLWSAGHASLAVSAGLWFGPAQAFGVAGLLFLAMSLIENFDR